MGKRSSNVSFLAGHAPLLTTLGANAERVFSDNAAIYVFKLRMLTEAFRGDLVPQYPDDGPTAELLTRLAARRDSAPQR
jgi:hypothetical protein